MEHENVDENAKYLTACENVKKIVNAIKKIRMKYYINFAKITPEDKLIYDKLETNLEQIAEANDLENLKVALMEEVSIKYDRDSNEEQNNEQGNRNFTENLINRCYGAIDVQKKALSAGKIRKARECQKILEEYLENVNDEKGKQLVLEYKREKFGELIRDKDKIQEKNENWMEMMKGFCKLEYAKERKKAIEEVEQKEESVIPLFNKKVITEEIQIG